MVRTLTSLVAACWLGTAPAHAVGFEVTVQGGRELTLAIAQPQTPSGDPQGVARTMRDTLERDLNLTGYFEIVPTAAHIERGRGVTEGSFAYGDWRTIQVAALIKPRVLPAGDPRCEGRSGRMCLDIYLYDVLGERRLGAKRVLGTPEEASAMAHQAANEVLKLLVGEEGFFHTSLLAVRKRGDTKEIYVVDAGGGSPRPVTKNHSLNLSPAWSPTQREVAWTTYRRGDADVYVKNLRSGSVRALSTTPGLDISPSFSPDGRVVAVARSRGGDTDIFLVDAATGADIRQLTRGGGIDVSPHISPDGRHVVFASERSGGSQIYVVPITGGSARRVTTIGGFFTDPVWSPDGQKIAFVSRRGAFEVLTVNADGSGMVRITQGQGNNEDPTWSPDGRYLAFSSDRSGRQEIWVATANGRHQAPITTGGGWSQPTWTR